MKKSKLSLKLIEKEINLKTYLKYKHINYKNLDLNLNSSLSERNEKD